MPPELIYSTPFFIASISMLIVALFTFLRGKSRSALYLILLSLSGAFWAGTEGMLYLGLDIEISVLITHIQYLGVTPLIPLTLIFTMSMFGYEAWVNRTTILLLIIIGVTIVLLVWTNPLHHVVFSAFFRIDSGPVPMLGLKHGFLWWVIIGYHYLLGAIMSLILLKKTITSTGVQRCQAGVILVAVGILWASNAVYVTGHSPVPNMDLGPLAFILVGLSMAWGFFRYNLLNVLPIAKTQIFQALNDPIIVLDEKDRVLDLNPAAESLLNLRVSESIGRDIDELFIEHLHLTELLRQERQAREVTLILQNGKRFFDLHISASKGKGGEKIGRILIFHDITQRKQADQAMREGERLQGVLEMAGAVCHDLSQPVAVLSDCSDFILKRVSPEDAIHQKILKLTQQTYRLKETTQRLMRITRYETRSYLGNQIIDIERASPWADRGES